MPGEEADADAQVLRTILALANSALRQKTKYELYSLAFAWKSLRWLGLAPPETTQPGKFSSRAIARSFTWLSQTVRAVSRFSREKA